MKIFYILILLTIHLPTIQAKFLFQHSKDILENSEELIDKNIMDILNCNMLDYVACEIFPNNSKVLYVDQLVSHFF